MTTRNYSAELLKFRKEHTFDPNCPKCRDHQGYKGKIQKGWQKGAYIPCDCAKKKRDMIETTGGNIPLATSKSEAGA